MLQKGYIIQAQNIIKKDNFDKYKIVLTYKNIIGAHKILNIFLVTNNLCIFLMEQKYMTFDHDFYIVVDKQ